MTNENNFKFFSLYVFIFFAFNASGLNAQARDLPLETVPYVNIEKYLGTWYEIARFEHSFQKGCIESKAEYSLRSDGDLSVVNSCRLQSSDGKLKVAKGRAWVVDHHTNSKLKVQFFLSKFKIPFLAGNYWILSLDDQYTHVLIGEPSRKYLWILSRSKKMDDADYNELVAKAKELQFDVSQLIKTQAID